MDFHLVRTEVRRLGKKNLFKMLMGQKESKCLLNGLCSLRFNYKGYPFCISEVLGEGCESQRLKNLEQEACEARGEPISQEKVEVLLFDCMEGSSYNFY
jgi:hypothetical protein